MDVCRLCGVELTKENWAPHQKQQNRFLCRPCVSAYRTTRYHAQFVPSDNKESATYLGVNVAEEVLSRIFKDVERMPYGHSGYDFVCNKGMKIDSKASIMNHDGRSAGRWRFRTKKNTIADYFVFLAFDDRKHLTPLHIWLIPSIYFENVNTPSISIGTIDKWDEFRLPIDKVVMCCDTMR